RGCLLAPDHPIGDGLAHLCEGEKFFAHGRFTRYSGDVDLRTALSDKVEDILLGDPAADPGPLHLRKLDSMLPCQLPDGRRVMLISSRSRCHRTDNHSADSVRDFPSRSRVDTPQLGAHSHRLPLMNVYLRQLGR